MQNNNAKIIKKAEYNMRCGDNCSRLSLKRVLFFIKKACYLLVYELDM